MPADLLALCRERLAPASWAPDTVTGDAFAFDTCAVDLPELDAWIAMDTLRIRERCGLPANCVFAGQVKRLVPGSRFPWHRDHRGGRLLGMSVNLSAEPAVGGVFEQRLRWESAPRVTIHSGPGDVHVFDVSDARLVHRVTPVERGARVVLAGWWRVD
ncbi:MAG: 2OG-Fe(II) oxygenase [Deltaproteobacteria bacterium]|nr:MAG: 2OG-Fe(II) oxygenase [Deltaproteobacteria bacterium]